MPVVLGALTLLLGVAGCSDDPEKRPEITPRPITVTKLYEDQDFVFTTDKYDIVNHYGSSTGEKDFTGTINHIVINVDSPEVAEINNILEERFHQGVQGISRDEYGDSSFLLLDYSFSESYGILSLLVSETGVVIASEPSEIAYNSYNIDLSTGKTLTAEEILALYGWSMDKTMAHAKDEVSGYIFAILEYEQTPELLDEKVEQATITPDNAVYIDEHGVGVYIVQGVHAGNHTTPLFVLI